MNSTVAFNQAAHDFLIAAGYQHEQIPAEWHDNGGPESGPDIQGHHAFDLYTGAEDYVFIDEYGTTAIEKRDPAFEQYMAECAADFESHAF